MTTDRFCAEYDKEGGIRLSCGRGELIATANHTRNDVQGWADRAGGPEWKQKYEAALALLDGRRCPHLDEHHESVERVTTVDRPGGSPQARGRRTVGGTSTRKAEPMTTPSAFPPVNRTIERALSEAIDIQDLASAIVIALRADGYALAPAAKGPTGVSSFAIHTNEQTGIDAPDERMDDEPDRIAWSHSQQVPNGVLVVCRSGHICERHPLYDDTTGATALVERTSRRPIAYGSTEGPFTRYREVIPTLSATAATTAILSTPNSRVDTGNRDSLRSVHRMMWTAMYVELNEQHMRDIGKPWRSTTNDAAFAYETFANNPY